jgi:cobalt-zinc-cadmium efflux system outer membrane protein
VSIWLFVLLQAVSSSQTVPAKLTLAALEAQALAAHPAIRVAAAEVDAAKARVGQAGAWTNPVIGVTADELRPREQPSGIYGGFIQQTIPLGGKLGAAKNTATSEVALAEAALATARRRVLLDVRERYYAVAIAEERLSVATDLAGLAGRAVEMARQLKNVGIADQPDVLSAEAEAARMAARLVEARAVRAAAWQRLGAAVADTALAPQPLAQDMAEALPVLDRAETLASVIASSGVVATAERSLAVERSRVAMAKSMMTPDLFLRGDVGANRERTGRRTIGPQFGLEAGISIPLFNRNAGGILSATSKVSGAEAAVSAARLDVEASFASVFADYESARAMVEAYRDEILPKTREAYNMQIEKYQQMVAAYPPVLQTERTYIAMTEDYLSALDRAWMAVSALRTAMAVRP